MSDKPAYDSKHPFLSKIAEKRPLGSPRSTAEALHVALDLAPDGPTYASGDTFGVAPRNAPEDVAQLLELQKLTGDELVQPPRCAAPLPLREALASKLHFLARPTTAFVKAALEAAGTPYERAALQTLLDSPPERFTAYAAPRQLPEVLAEHQSVRFGAQKLAEVLPPLNPRLFSIASSPLVHPREVHLCISVARYESLGRPRRGVASTWLADRAVPGETPVPVFPAKGSLRLPGDDSDSVMFGPGTGIAPFRAFLQERGARGAKGRNWLFYGNRVERDDFYYREEIEAWREDGLLTKLSLAWSRDSAEKRYVQHLLWESRDEVWQWFEGGATIFICGRKNPMSTDVEAMLCRIAAEKKATADNSPEAASAWLAEMKKQKRLQCDVY